jgi:hypothetical protein
LFVGLVSRLVPRSVSRHYLDIKKRLAQLETAVWHLETAVDTLIANREYVAGRDLGFNGQRYRKRIFADVVRAISADAIVETGTWLGDTTGYMAETSGLPVYSCDVNPRFHSLAKMRLAHIDGVHLSRSDSRRFLDDLARGPLVERCVFFYLDAHWYDDLPLREELACIADRWTRYAVMVDDFRVPDDPGYGYDDFGDGKILALEALGFHHLTAYFPAARSTEETGKRRGCVVLAPSEMVATLEAVESLRPWEPSGPV